MRRENNQWLGWINRLLKTYVLSMEDKMAPVEHLGALGIMDETALSAQFHYNIIINTTTPTLLCNTGFASLSSNNFIIITVAFSF